MKNNKLTPVEVIVLSAIVVVALAAVIPAATGSRQTEIRLRCRVNLKGIASAMTDFANDNDGNYPRAGLPPDPYGSEPGARWTNIGVLFRPYDPDPYRAFRHGATVTSSLYLLVKYAYLPTRQFNCPGDTGVLEFKLKNMYIADPTLTLYDIWDFGNGRTASGSGLPPIVMPGEFCSYAYHMPYVSPSMPYEYGFPITGVWHPSSPVCADRNPFLDKNAPDPNIGDNSACHQATGQNVLFRDGSVSFVNQPTVGLNGDNIYTYGGELETGGGDPIGTPPVYNGDGGPFGPRDAYLVGEKNDQL